MKKHSLLRYAGAAVPSVLLLLAGCGLPPTAPAVLPTAQPPAPTAAPVDTITPAATAVPPTAVPPIPGEWRRVTPVEGLCSEWPVLIGLWFIGSGGTTFCYPDGPLDAAGTAWVRMTVPIGTRVTAAVKFPPGGGLVVATDAGPCVYWPGQQPGAEGSWECRTAADGFPHTDIRGMVNLGIKAVYMLPDSVALLADVFEAPGQLYSIPEITGAAEARPTWIAGIQDPAEEIWVGTNGYGVAVIDAASGMVRRYTAADGLPDDTVRDVASTSSGKMGPGYPVWVATAAGVGRWDGQRWTAYTTADGLPSNDVRGVSAAGPGTAWAATAGGAAYFDGTAWFAFTPENGLPEGELKGVLVTAYGAWFSTRGSGLIVFLPR